MNPCELTASITAVANMMACGLTTEELDLLGAVLTQLADTLFTISAQRSLCPPLPKSSGEVLPSGGHTGIAEGGVDDGGTGYHSTAERV